MMKIVLVCGFRGTSAEKLLGYFPDDAYDKLILENDKEKCAEQIISAGAAYDIVLMFGQRPNIKNKVHVEQCAKNGEMTIFTGSDCECLVRCLNACGIRAKISSNAGTSYCNHVYYAALSNGMNAVFVHIPFEKNLSEDLYKKAAEAIKTMLDGSAERDKISGGLS